MFGISVDKKSCRLYIKDQNESTPYEQNNEVRKSAFFDFTHSNSLMNLQWKIRKYRGTCTVEFNEVNTRFFNWGERHFFGYIKCSSRPNFVMILHVHKRLCLLPCPISLLKLDKVIFSLISLLQK